MFKTYEDALQAIANGATPAVALAQFVIADDFVMPVVKRGPTINFKNIGGSDAEGALLARAECMTIDY